MELFGVKKKIMRQCVISALKNMVQISNSNLMRNADALLAEMDKDAELTLASSQLPTDYLRAWTVQFISWNLVSYHLVLFIEQCY